jgi:hypothetical protein
LPFASSLLIITASETIKASVICSSSPGSVALSAPDQFDAEAASAECSIIMIGQPGEVGHSSFWILRDLVAHYEQLRRDARDVPARCREGLGLALFLRRGMAA